MNNFNVRYAVLRLKYNTQDEDELNRKLFLYELYKKIQRVMFFYYK